MRRIPILAAVAILLTAIPAHALVDFEAGVRGIYWFPDLSAKAQTFRAGAAETEIDVKNDLNVGNENFPAGEAFLRYGRFHFRVGTMPVKFDGSIRLARQIVFNGQTYNASDNVVSHLNLKMIDGEVQFDLLRPDLYAANVNLGILLKVKYVDGSVELRSQAATQKKDFKAPLPMIGLGTGVAMLKNLLRADARATGIAYAGNHLYEGDAFLTFSPIPFFAVQGGYRLIDLKIDDDDILATLKLKGPYVGAQLSF